MSCAGILPGGSHPERDRAIGCADVSGRWQPQILINVQALATNAARMWVRCLPQDSRVIHSPNPHNGVPIERKIDQRHRTGGPTQQGKQSDQNRYRSFHGMDHSLGWLYSVLD